MEPGPGAKEGPVADALALGAEALSCLGRSRGLLVPGFSLSGPKCLCPWQQRSLQVETEGRLQCRPMQPPAGPGTPLAQDIHQQLA